VPPSWSVDQVGTAQLLKGAIVAEKLTIEPTAVVCHSLGSVVAFSVLRRDARALNVPIYVTVDCPLAVRSIRVQFLPLRWPKPATG
jgi:hypothetical protein